MKRRTIAFPAGRAREGAILLLYAALALVLTYPLLLHLDTHVPGRGIDDPALTWNLWWVQYSIFHLGTSPLYTDYLYYPLGVNLVAYTSTFLNGVISLPLQFLFGVIVANNLVIYFALVAGGYGAYLLAREVLAQVNAERGELSRDIRNGRHYGAILAGAFYAFGAWHINYVAAGHFMLLSNEWIPFFALYLIRLSKGAWRAGALAGLYFVLAAWTELTFISFMAVLAALYLAFLLIARRGELGRRFALGVGALAAVAGIGVSPLLVNLLLDFQRYGYYLAPGLGRVQVFSAEPISFLIPSAQHPFLGAWADAVTKANTSYAFFGYAALFFVVAGAWVYRAQKAARLWAVAAIFFALVLLGPTLIVGGESTGVPLPFALLRLIPFVNANRYPVRFNVMLMLGAVPLLALGAARLARTARGRGAAVLLTALLALEQLAAPIPLTDLRGPAVFQSIRREPGDSTLLDIPLGWRNSVSIQGTIDYKAQFFQTVHEKRLVGGLTSRNPAWKFQYYLELPVFNSLITLENGGEIDDGRRAADRAAAPALIRFFAIRYVEVQRALTPPGVLDFIREVFPLTEISRDEERIVYRVAQPSAALGTVDLASETARLYFDEGWGRVQSLSEGGGYRWAARADAHIWLPLAADERQVRFRLLGAHVGQRVDVRIKGVRVTTLTLTNAWEDQTIVVPDSVAGAGLRDIEFDTETVPVGAVRQGDRTIGDTGVAAPVDLVATGAGFDAGRFGEIFVDGKNVIPNRRGYHLVAVNPQTGQVDRIGVFDTFADPGESARLAEFVGSLPQGEIVAGAAIDEVSRQLQPVAVEALRQLGVESDLRFQFRAGHAFIGVKGAQPGQALEQVNGRWPANVAAGKNIAGDRAAFALAGITVER